eukprot:m.596274 g.596274  ORF g.596274 m.596274 type:complete len:156 (-) comp22408_c0_seq6:2004-2471(-)
MGCCSDSGERRILAPDPPRGCTDILFSIIFVLFCIGIAAISGWSVDNGEPLRLVNGADSFGNICGVKNDKRINSPYSGIDMTGFDHMYFTLNGTDAQSADFGVTLCLKECPTEFAICSSDTDACTGAGVCFGSGAYVTRLDRHLARRLGSRGMLS